MGQRAGLKPVDKQRSPPYSAESTKQGEQQKQQSAAEERSVSSHSAVQRRWAGPDWLRRRRRRRRRRPGWTRSRRIAEALSSGPRRRRSLRSTPTFLPPPVEIMKSLFDRDSRLPSAGQGTEAEGRQRQETTGVKNHNGATLMVGTLKSSASILLRIAKTKSS